MIQNLEKISVDGLQFMIRPNTSDIKCIDEIIKRKEYKRRYFKISTKDHWLDLGGNIGVFGIWAVHNGAARVTAYEPFEQSHELYLINIELNKMQDKIRVFQHAVTASESERIMGINKNGNFWRNSLIKTPAKGGEIRVFSLDFESVIKAHNPNCVKMDIEGSEFEILDNRIGLLKGLEKFVYEHSFDIDPSISKYRKYAETLSKLFDNIKYDPIKSTLDTWQPSWFPPCRKIFCWNNNGDS